MHHSLMLITSLVTIALCLGASTSQAAELPDPKTGGAGKGPIAILF